MSLPRNLLDESLKKDDMKRTICFPIFSIMLYACSNSIQTDNAKYNITFDDNNFVEVKDKVSDLEVIELELTEEALIPVINSISVHGDKIFCFSCEQNGFIKVFDTKGKFLYDISHHGSANNEWIRLKSMYIDEGDSSIILTDAESKKLLIYTLDDKFVKSIRLGEFDYHQITHHDGYFYSLTHTFMTGGEPTEETDHRINIYDNDGKLVSQTVPLKLNDARMMEMNRPHFYMGQERCLLCPTLDNTAYELENGQCSPYIAYNYIGKTPLYTKKDIQQAIDNNEWLAGKEKTYYGGRIIESPNLIIRRMGDENAMDVIFNKQEGDVITTSFDSPALMQDHLSACFLYPFPECYSDGFFYGNIQYELLALSSQYIDGFIPDCMKEVAEKVKAGNVNNIIVRYKLKGAY